MAYLTQLSFAAYSLLGLFRLPLLVASFGAWGAPLLVGAFAGRGPLEPVAPRRVLVVLLSGARLPLD